MKPISVSAPGKLHLLGEHAVVYGKPAIIAAIDKRCFVEITPRKDKKIAIYSHNPLLYARHSGKRSPVPDGTGPSPAKISNRSERFWTSPWAVSSGSNCQNDQDNIYRSGVFTEKEILGKTEYARKQWKSYTKTDDIAVLKYITVNSLDYIVISVGETLRYFGKKLPFGFSLSIKSDIPIGSGMGSSAALAVSVAGAVSLLLTKRLNKEIVNEIAFLAEQKKHGFPSGGDNSASCFGGLIWYRRETPDLKIIKPIPFMLPKTLARNFIAIHTGIPAESTGEIISLVRDLYKKKPEFVESIMSSQEKLTREILSAVKNNDSTLMIYIIKAGEKNLESLGVVSEFAKSIIREVEASGGAAKICGGGGIKHGAGILLGYHSDKKATEKIANNLKLSYCTITFGGEGLREENYA